MAGTYWNGEAAERKLDGQHAKETEIVSTAFSENDYSSYVNMLF